MPENVLEMLGIAKRFGNVSALANIDLALGKGEVLGLVGENGAGKSTLMKILSGAYQKDSGAIRIRGAEVDLRSPSQARALGIAVIYQELSLFPDLSAVDNIFAGRELQRGRGLHVPLSLGRMREAARRIFEDVLHVRIDLDAPVGSLSLAHRQLVEIARALDGSADIIVMDEPTEALEQGERDQLRSIISKLKASGKSIVYVSHRLDELLSLSDRVMVLRDGEAAGCFRKAEIDVPRIISLMIGGSLEEQFPSRIPFKEDVLLKVEGFGRNRAFRDVGFELRAGELIGVAGLNGSGKSQLLRSLFGASPADSGEIWVRGHRLGVPTIDTARRHGLAFVPAERKVGSIFPEHSLAWNTTIANLGTFGPATIDAARETSLTEANIRQLGVRCSGPSQPIGELSGGNQQKVILGRWLQTAPNVLLLEEPTRGIDIRAKADVYRLVRQAAAAGVGGIVVSSDNAELLGLCDRILVMFEGRIVKELDCGSTTEAEIASFTVQDVSATQAM